MFVHRSLTVWIGSSGLAWIACLGCSANAGSNGSGGASATGGSFSQLTPMGGQGGAPAQPTATSPDMNPPPNTNPASSGGSNGAGGSPPIEPPGSGGFAESAGSGGALPSSGGLGGALPSSGGSSPMPGTGGAPMTTAACPMPPADAPMNAVLALNALNQIRLAAGAGCMDLVSALDKSAQAHCDYEAANAGNPSCTSDPHGEVSTCTGYTGDNVQAREVAAGYSNLLAYTEVLTTYGNQPVLSVQGWIDTVFHRIPLLDPWIADMGYGGATMCDVIDIGRGMSTMPASTIVVYPYDGQTDVPPTFSGLEGPQPPAPSGGYPSSYPINIYAQGLKVTGHVLTKDGDSTPIDHLWLDANSSQLMAGYQGYFFDTAFLYGAPFELSTKYHVTITGTYSGGTLDKEWTFTTAATRPFGT